MNTLRIAYFGTPHIAVPPLEVLHKTPEVEVVFAGVFPDKKVGRKQILTPCPVKAKALELGISTLEIRSKDDLRMAFGRDFDLAIVIAFGMIFPKELFEAQTRVSKKPGSKLKDIINVHFSLLPQYRGASPVQSSILNGDQVSGITFQRMVYNLDEGDILLQKEYDITDHSTSTLWSFFAEETAHHMPPFLQAYADDKIASLPQGEVATYCEKFEKSDGLVDLEKDDPITIYRKYKAFDVWPGIYTQTKYGRLKLTQITLKNGTINIKRAQLEGKKEMALEEILKGKPDLLLGK